VSLSKPVKFILEILGPLCLTSGILLIIPGIWLVTTQLGVERPLAAEIIPLIFMVSSIVLMLSGFVINRAVERDNELEERSYLLPPLPTDLSKRQIFTHVVPKEAMCPSCGFANHSGAYFCEACNSPLWSSGTPRGQPPDPVTVKERRSSMIARHRLKRRLVIAVIVVLLITPLASSLGLGYTIVNHTFFTVGSAIFIPDPSPTSGILLFDADFFSPTSMHAEPVTGSYAATLHNTSIAFSLGSYDAFVGTDIVHFNAEISGVSLTAMNGTTIAVVFTGIIHYSLYYQQVRLSSTMVCGFDCARTLF
jgi:hypothetical protein